MFWLLVKVCSVGYTCVEANSIFIDLIWFLLLGERFLCDDSWMLPALFYISILEHYSYRPKYSTPPSSQPYDPVINVIVVSSNTKLVIMGQTWLREEDLENLSNDSTVACNAGKWLAVLEFISVYS